MGLDRSLHSVDAYQLCPEYNSAHRQLHLSMELP